MHDNWVHSVWTITMGLFVVGSRGSEERLLVSNLITGKCISVTDGLSQWRQSPLFPSNHTLPLASYETSTRLWHLDTAKYRWQSSEFIGNMVWGTHGSIIPFIFFKSLLITMQPCSNAAPIEALKVMKWFKYTIMWSVPVTLANTRHYIFDGLK